MTKSNILIDGLIGENVQEQGKVITLLEEINIGFTFWKRDATGERENNTD